MVARAVPPTLLSCRRILSNGCSASAHSRTIHGCRAALLGRNSSTCSAPPMSGRLQKRSASHHSSSSNSACSCSRYSSGLASSTGNNSEAACSRGVRLLKGASPGEWASVGHLHNTRQARQFSASSWQFSFEKADSGRRSRKGICLSSRLLVRRTGGDDAAFLLVRPSPWAIQIAGIQTSSGSASGRKGIDDELRTKVAHPSSSAPSQHPGAAAAAAGATGSSSDTRSGERSPGRTEGSELDSDAAAAAASAAIAAVKRGEQNVVDDAKGPRMTDMRDRFRDAREDAREDAKDWIRDKRDDMDEMRETLQDARRDGRLRQELSKQAKQRRSRLQELWHKYGAVGIGCYLTIYFGSTAFFYVVYDYGVMTNLPSGGTAVIEHMQEWMKSTPEWAQQYSERLFGAMAEDHRARSFVLAWATCKVIEPLRLVASIAVTPRVARALGRAPAKGDDDDDDDDEDENVEGAARRRERDLENSGKAGPDDTARKP